MTNNVGLIGLGYVGLTLSVFLSEKGVNVYGVDDDDFKVEELKKGNSYFFETGFDEKLRAHVNNKLKISSDLRFVSNCEYIFITIGTPFNKEKDVADPLIPLIRDLMPVVKLGCIFIIRSTVQLGATRKYQNFVENNDRPDIKFAFCPERTIEGDALSELNNLPQIVAAENDRILENVSSFFETLGVETVNLSSYSEGELAKLVSNASRDLNFAVSNEIAIICSYNDLNPLNVIHAINHKYPRAKISYPGTVGGPCLEKDPEILLSNYPIDNRQSVFRSGRNINLSTIEHALNFVDKKIQLDTIKSVGILGLGFKGRPKNTDLRGSMALSLAKKLKNIKNQINVYGLEKEIDERYLPINEPYLLDADIHLISDEQDFFKSCDVIFLQNNAPLISNFPWADIMDNNDIMLVFDFWPSFHSKFFAQNRNKYMTLGKVS